MKLRPVRVEDVPVPELSSLALLPVAGGPPELLAIGDKKAVAARAPLTDEPLDWTVVDLPSQGIDAGAQLEGIAALGHRVVALLCEDPPRVFVVDLDARTSACVTLLSGEHGIARKVFAKSASGGEGLLGLRDDRLLIVKEKRPALLVELGAPGMAATAISQDSFLRSDEPAGSFGSELEALAAWRVDDVDDLSDLAVSGGALYCLSDQSQRVVAIELPLDPGRDRASASRSWDLEVPERRGEPEGKPEGLVVMDDGTFIVGLDTRSPRANLCWYET